MRTRALLVAGVGFLMAVEASPRAARAQSAQPFALQASLFIADLGAGYELQARYSPSAFSLGVGFQSIATTSISLGTIVKQSSGVFIEPRYAIDIQSDKYAPYISGRVALLRSSDAKNYDVFGAGAGLLIKMTSRVNLDMGIAGLGETGTGNSFGVLVKAGASLGFGGGK